MAQNAIAQSPGIFLQGSQLYQNANSKIFDAINGAAEMYEKMQAQKQANLTSLLAKQAEINSDPEKSLMLLQAKANQYGPQALTPQESAQLQTSKQVLGAQNAINPANGTTYPKWNMVGMGGAPSPVAAMMAPTPQAPAVQSDMLPPPRVDGKPSSLKDYQKTVAPINQPAEKVKLDVDDTGVGQTPTGQMEKYKADLDTAKEIAVNNAKTQAEQQKANFYKPKLQDVLDQMANINDQLQKAGALKSKDNSAVGNVMSMAAGAEIPFTGIKPGRAIEEMANKKIASLRDQYDGLKGTALSLYKNAANIAAGSLNSDAEQKLALTSFGDPNGSYEANKRALETTMSSYGTKKADSKDDAKSLSGLKALPDGFKDLGGGYAQGPDGKKYKIKHD